MGLLIDASILIEHERGGLDVRARRSAFVEAILESFPLLPIDLPIARAHTRLRANLAAAG